MRQKIHHHHPWLSVNPPSGTTRTTLTLTVTPSILGAGVYGGTVTITPNNGGTPLVVGVTATATAAPSVMLDSGTVAFTAAQGGTQNCGTKPIGVSSSLQANPLNYTVTASVDTPAGGKWLTASSQGSGTPGNFTIACNPAGLGPGNYSGRVIVSTNDFGGSSQTVNVTLAVSSVPPSLIIGASPVGFTYQQGGGPSCGFPFFNLTQFHRASIHFYRRQCKHPRAERG